MIITTFGIVAERAMNNSEYLDIHCWDYIKRKRLDRIEKFFVNNENQSHCENYVLWFEDIPLIVNEYCECYVNPYLIKNVTEFIDVTEKYISIVGRKLRNLKYMDAYTANLCFYNNKKLMFHFPNRVGVINVLFQEKIAPIELGTEVSCVKFRSGRSYAEHIRTYSQHSAYLCTNDSVYQITSENLGDTQNSKLNITKVNNSFINGFEESIQLFNGRIKDYYLWEKTNNEYAICIECSKGYLYIRDQRTTNMIPIICRTFERNPLILGNI